VKRRFFLAAGSAALAAGAARARAFGPEPSLREKLTTRAEASNYQQTSSYADVQRFLNDLDERGAPIFRGSLGRSAQGREIPFVIASRPRVVSPEKARALNRPIVYVQACLHGNEVDGKEAILALLRDLCVSTDKTLLEDVVFAIVPIANPDGHESYGPAAQNAPEQNGPLLIGTAHNGDGIDLDHDFVKLEAPETRAILDFVKLWQPDVFLDLRADAGSFHDFGSTHAPPMHPAAFFGGAFARERLLPAVHKELRDKFGIRTFVCGQFGRAQPLPAPPPPSDTTNYGWFGPDYRTRHATNYFGLRGSIAALVESYCHDDFGRRVFTTRASIESLVGYCSDSDDDVLANSKMVTHWLGGRVPLRAAYPARPPVATVGWENLAVTSDSDSTEPGVPKGLKRTDTFSSAALPIYDHFVPTLSADQTKGYLIPYEYAALARRLLDRHGIAYTVATTSETTSTQQFVVERVDGDASEPDEQRTIVVNGNWTGPISFAAKLGAVFVPTVQTLGPLVSVLLEPESDDSFFTWNIFEGSLTPGSSAPVFRVL
jgi:hypothetical protein